MSIATKSYLNLGGTIRSLEAEETFQNVAPYLKALGITRIANITGLDKLDVPVAICIRPNAKHISTSQGKGLTWELARLSAIFEAIEAYHAENPALPALHGTFNNLKSNYPVFNPEAFLAGDFTLKHLKDYPLSWCLANNLLKDKKSVFIPHALVHLNSTGCYPEYNFFSISSNGLAAGNTIQEALLHAIYEIIERDSLYRWGLLAQEKRIKTQVKLDSIHSSINQMLLEKFLAAEQLVKIWDISSDLNIPSFHCVIKDTNPLQELGMFRGTGTHMNKEIALSRALTEAAQSRLGLISGSRDDIFSDHYQRKRSFIYSKDEYQGVKDYKNCYQPPINACFEKDLNYLYSKLLEKNFTDILMVDHTKSDFNIVVVHVFIPGMQFNGARI